MATASVYLTFDGNCEAAFKFYHSVFGGDTLHFGKLKDMPNDGSNQNPMSKTEGNKIVHVSLPISKETNLMGSDAFGVYAKDLIVGNNFSVALNVDNKLEADRLFEALSEGGNITMPLNKTFWGAYFGMLTDRFGINWMMNFDL